MDKLISIVRRPEQLLAVISRPKHKFTFPLGNKKGNSNGQLNSFYQTTTLPLSNLPNDLCANKDQLLKAWNALQNIRVFDAETLYQILVVLIETQTDIDADAVALPPINIFVKVDQIEQVRSRGKHYRAPKIKQPPVIDLSGYLCEPRYCSLLLSRLKMFLPKALAKLARDGYQVDKLTVAYQQGINSFDPYLAYHHSSDKSLSQCLPQSFISKILPLLKGLHWSELNKFLKVYWGLSLDRDQHLLIAVVRLLSLSKKPMNILQWCRIIAQQPLNRRAIFTTLLIKSGAYTLDAASFDVAILERFNAMTIRADYSKRLYELLRALKQGINSEYLLAGFQLNRRNYRDYTFDDIKNCTSFDLSAMTELLNHLRRSQNAKDGYSMQVWDCYGKLPDFDQVIKKLPWRVIPKETTKSLLHIFSDLRYYDLSDAALARKFHVILQHLDHIFEILLTVDKDYHVKFTSGIDYCFMYWDSVEMLRQNIPTFCSLLKRLCQRPFKKITEINMITRYFVGCANQQWRDMLLSAPDDSFLQLEKVLRKKNAAILISNGFQSMMKLLPGFTAQAFQLAPKSFLEMIHLLGSLNSQRRIVTLKKFKNEFYQDNSEKLMANKNGAVDSVIQLKDFVLKELIGPHQLSLDPDRIFALQMSHEIECNQRPFKRFLKAYFQGQKDYLQTHPLTIKWIKQQKQLDIELWTNGIKQNCQTASHGMINLAMETEPLEVLKLGEYVGSCLGLGGIKSFSAPANLLDINKQVIYARNDKNRVIARQLLAISKERKLVCFCIYPDEIDSEIKELFKSYDLEFAKLLGLEIYDSKDDEEYNIEFILSDCWYDDYHWDLKI